MLTLTGVERSYAAAIGETMQNLSVRAEVGSVMESMLGDLEAWKWANNQEALKAELEHAKAQVAALRASERALLKVFDVVNCSSQVRGWQLCLPWRATGCLGQEQV